MDNCKIFEEMSNLTLERMLTERGLLRTMNPNELAARFIERAGIELDKLQGDHFAAALARAIIAGYDEAQNRATKRLCMILECERTLEDRKAGPGAHAAARRTKDALLDRRDHGLALVDSRELDAANDALGRALQDAEKLRKDLTQARDDLEQARAQLADMERRKDAAYLERNQVVAALAKSWPSGVARTAIEGWSEDWHGCVYIDLPTGQASWHFHDSQAYLFESLKPYSGTWDGHSTEEKYRRLAQLPHLFDFDLQDAKDADQAYIDQIKGKNLTTGSWFANNFLLTPPRALNLSPVEDPRISFDQVHRLSMEDIRHLPAHKQLADHLRDMPGLDIDAVYRVQKDAYNSGTGILSVAMDPSTMQPKIERVDPQELRTLTGLGDGPQGQIGDDSERVASVTTDEPSADQNAPIVPYEGEERRGVHIPGAVWPDPAKTRFNVSDLDSKKPVPPKPSRRKGDAKS